MDDTDVTAAPEPTSIVLIGTGLLLLLIRGWWGNTSTRTDRSARRRLSRV
jgi:hypothetical protein